MKDVKDVESVITVAIDVVLALWHSFIQLVFNRYFVLLPFIENNDKEIILFNVFEKIYSSVLTNREEFLILFSLYVIFNFAD